MIQRPLLLRLGSLRRLAACMALALLSASLTGCRGKSPAVPTRVATPIRPGTSFELQRQQMVASQLQARGVKDTRVLAAMGKVPREEFVPAEARARAYEDGPLPIGEGQTISQPYVVALMTELLAVTPGDKVLEIGTGSGYQAAILAELTPKVYTIEIIPTLARQAGETLHRLGYNTVEVKAGDGYLGWPEYAPFDGIIVTCAPTDVPQPLKDQLKDGGRMVIPVGSQLSGQTLYLLRKRGKKLEQTAVIPVRFVPMVRGEKQQQ